jgi:magnesium-protoporphyrin IX monomethyl ester (oxidative) cyclase
MLEKKHDVKLVYQDLTRSDVEMFAPDLVGISCIFSLQEAITFELARFIKDLRPHAKTVVGGTHPTALPERMLAGSDIDFVILGEGERSMSELTDCIDNSMPIEGIDGLAYKKNGTVKINPKTTLVENLDELPIPSLVFDGTVSKSLSLAHATWNRLALLGFAARKHSAGGAESDKKAILERKKNSFDIQGRFESKRTCLEWVREEMQCLVTSRGCPFDCSYCTSQMMWKKRYRVRSIESLLEEIRRFPHDDVLICDENMTLDRERAKDFFKAVAPLKKRFFFYNGVDPYTLDAELIELMKDAGVTKLSISIETGSPDTSKAIHRRLDLLKIKQVLAELQKNRILTAVYFIVGFPGETERDILHTVSVMEYCMKNFPVIIHAYKFLLLPGSRLYEKYSGDMRSLDFDKYCFFPIEDYEVFQLNDSVALIPSELRTLVGRDQCATATGVREQIQ